MQKLTGKYVQDLTLVEQSEFKKPYLENSYPEMEHFQYPGFPEPKFPSGPGAFNKDCTVGYEAAGAVVGWRICAPSDDCAGWIFTCAHKIVSFTCGNCQIGIMQQLSGDRVLVIICSGEDNLAVKYKTNDGVDHVFGPKRTCLGTDPDPACVGSGCANCKATPDIGYTTQQMSTSGGGSTQNLNADGGGGGPYTWSILSGGGTLSKLKTTNNEMTLYTAPSSNTDCANNPIIQVKDYCGHPKTLKLAVNGGGTGVGAYAAVNVSYGTCSANATGTVYDCAGNSFCTLSGASCTATPPGCLSPFGCACPHNGCVYNFAPCRNGTMGCGGITVDACPGAADKRTSAQKTAGCCPAALL